LSELAPGLTGVWQLYVQIPEGAPSGALPVTIWYEGRLVGSAAVE
jgi:uncharacterized protein (TIGR03437 family)